MSRSKTKQTPQEHEPLYTREALLASNAFAGYQKDFARVALTEPMYTIADAKKAIEALLHRRTE